MSSRSLSPGFFDPRNYREDDDNENERDGDDNDNENERDDVVVVVPQNAMASPNALTAMIAWWFASSPPGSSSPGCQCGGGERRPGITKIYTY